LGDLHHGTREPFEISPRASIGHVKLKVYDIQRSLNFYEQMLGFKPIGRITDENVFLFAEGNKDYLIHLSNVDYGQKTNKREGLVKRAGLFHFAILLPNRSDLANVFRHLTENSDKLYFEGAADHLVSESLYLRDPDNNGVEIYGDKNRSEWKRIGEFQVEMSTERLDLDQLYQEADNFGPWRMPENTVIGHVHLHVSNLSESKKFYSEILGLHHTCTFPGAYFFAADLYHHHVATNTWLGADIQEANSEELGLDYFKLKLPSKPDFGKLLRQLQSKDIEIISDTNDNRNSNSVFIHDPDQIKIQISHL
jgi:catechol 2,3-dioxygenase